MGKPSPVPSEIRKTVDRLWHAKLEANSALYDPPDNPTPEDILLAKERTRVIGRAIDHTKPRAARVVRLRYGIGCEPHTLDQVAEQYGVGREHIRQIEAKAFRIMRHPARGLRDYATGRKYRFSGKACRNLHVPEWKRAEQRAAEQAAEQMEREIDALQELAWADYREQRDAHAIADAQRWHEEDMRRQIEARIDLQRRHVQHSEESFQDYVAHLYAACGVPLRYHPMRRR
jgi:hypothetical protein